MNFIITTHCNKGCPYCFAHENRKHDPNSYMDIEKFKRLVKKSKGSRVKLLGGEPTEHPQFKEIVDFLILNKIPFTLISNFLFSEEILNIILNAISRVSVTFLVNATDLDVSDRMKKWSYNYNTIYKKLYKMNKEEAISIGFTLFKKDLKYYLNYLDFVKENILNIERIRLSIAFPGNKEDKGNFFVINNKEIGNIFLGLIKKIINMGIRPSLDCILFPCMFNNKEEFKFVKRFLDKTKFKCGEGAPTDLFPDETISYCYPLKEAIKLDFNDYNNPKAVNENLLTKYKIIDSIVQKPKECLACNFFKQGMCAGPCLGFYDLSEISLGREK